MNPAPQQSLRSAPTVKALSPVAVITATRSAALEYARKIASNAPLVVQLLKRFVDRTVPKGPSEMAGLARREVDAITLSVDAAEGLAAFRDKRPPIFEGH
jgi:1,4-dihydroxy-2-naphthoyl-CoA synthase